MRRLAALNFIYLKPMDPHSCFAQITCILRLYKTSVTFLVAKTAGLGIRVVLLMVRTQLHC